MLALFFAQVAGEHFRVCLVVKISNDAIVDHRMDKHPVLPHLIHDGLDRGLQLVESLAVLPPLCLDLGLSKLDRHRRRCGSHRQVDKLSSLALCWVRELLWRFADHADDLLEELVTLILIGP